MRAERTGRVRAKWTERPRRVGAKWTLTWPTERASAGPLQKEEAVRLLAMLRRTRKWWGWSAWALSPQMARAPARARWQMVEVRLLVWVRQERRAGPARALVASKARSPPVLPMAQAPLALPMALVSAMVQGVVTGP